MIENAPAVITLADRAIWEYACRLNKQASVLQENKKCQCPQCRFEVTSALDKATDVFDFYLGIGRYFREKRVNVTHHPKRNEPPETDTDISHWEIAQNGI